LAAGDTAAKFPCSGPAKVEAKVIESSAASPAQKLFIGFLLIRVKEATHRWHFAEHMNEISCQNEQRHRRCDRKTARRCHRRVSEESNLVLKNILPPFFDALTSKTNGSQMEPASMNLGRVEYAPWSFAFQPRAKSDQLETVGKPEKPDWRRPMHEAMSETTRVSALPTRLA
jgi:hypothetical protein